jgi:hypothetical protein
VAQGFCSKSFDHKPIFLQLKKKRGTGRVTVSNRTIEHKLAMYVVKIAVYVTFLSACIPMAGLASGHLLLRDMETVSNIKSKINDIVSFEGIQLSQDLTDPEHESLQNLEAEVDELWNTVMSLDELQVREKQVRDEVFFEQLIENTRKSLLTFQTLLNTASKSALKVWTNELVRLRKDDYEANFERISELEKKLNESSEKYVLDRLSNFVKTDLLNSEKMMPLCCAPRFITLSPHPLR